MNMRDMIMSLAHIQCSWHNGYAWRANVKAHGMLEDFASAVTHNVITSLDNICTAGKIIRVMLCIIL